MKTEAAHTRPGYRNDIVFHSAERLIHSVAKKPARKLASRPVFFLGGMVCGLVLAVLLLPSAREAMSRVVNGRRIPSKSPDDPGPRFTFARSDPETAASVAPAAAAAGPNEVHAGNTAAASLPHYVPVSTQSRLASSIATPRIVDAAAPIQSIVVTESTTRITLKGELRSSSLSAAPIEINFGLQFRPHRTGGSLQGMVQVHDNPGPLAALHVAGVLVNRTITLTEINSSEPEKIPAWTSQRPTGYTFVIELPQAPATDEISGYWTHGPGQGTLLLTSVLAL